MDEIQMSERERNLVRPPMGRRASSSQRNDGSARVNRSRSRPSAPKVSKLRAESGPAHRRCCGPGPGPAPAAGPRAAALPPASARYLYTTGTGG